MQIVRTLDQAGLPLGLRNNNPGNLRAGSNWVGLIGIDSNGFCRFSSLNMGLRALAIDLRNAVNGGANTIPLLTNKYAPSSDGNNPVDYADYVAVTVFGDDTLGEQQVLDVSNTANGNSILLSLIIAFSQMENGASVAQGAIPQQTYEDAVTLSNDLSLSLS